MNQPQRIVLDTNCLLISIPYSSPYHTILTAFLSGAYTLCITNEILLEYEEILTQKIGKVIASNIVNAILSSRHTLLINPVYRFRLIESDPDNNKFVDCAIHANARYIVTEDHHYNILGQVPFPKVKVIGVDQFNQILITGINP